MKKIIILLTVVTGIAGYFGYHHWHNLKKNLPTSSRTVSTNSPKVSSTSTDKYAGWRTYSNSTYGVSFKYPSIWEASEGRFESSNSATKQEYAINIKRNETVKYNDTVSLEILNEPLSVATTWYDSYFEQSEINKSAQVLKGKQSVLYTKSENGANVSKAYLFNVGNKTYVFSSINEELNVQASTDYWTNFDKTFDSLEIN